MKHGKFLQPEERTAWELESAVKARDILGWEVVALWVRAMARKAI